MSQAESVLQPPLGGSGSGLPHGAHHVSQLEMQMGIQPRGPVSLTFQTAPNPNPSSNPYPDLDQVLVISDVRTPWAQLVLLGHSHLHAAVREVYNVLWTPC